MPDNELENEFKRRSRTIIFALDHAIAPHVTTSQSKWDIHSQDFRAIYNRTSSKCSYDFLLQRYCARKLKKKKALNTSLNVRLETPFEKC